MAVGIIHRCISAFIEQSRGKVGEPLYAEKYDALAVLERAMFSMSSIQFVQIFTDWQNAFDPVLRDALRPFIDTISGFLKECSGTTVHPKQDTTFKKLMEIISKQRRDRTDFDTMVFRLLYANKAALASPNGPRIWNLITSMTAPAVRSMTEFGVDIDMLYEEICLRNGGK